MDEEKLRDAIDSELTEVFVVQWQADEQIDKLLNSDKFTITLNEEAND